MSQSPEYNRLNAACEASAAALKLYIEAVDAHCAGTSTLSASLNAAALFDIAREEERAAWRAYARPAAVGSVWSCATCAERRRFAHD